MSYATRAAVIAGFFPFYYRQHAGSCFIGAFDCVTALLGYVLPSRNLLSRLGSPEAPAGSVYLACSPRVDSGGNEAQSFLPFTPGQIVKHPHRGAWIPTCSSCVYLPTLAPEKALIYHNGQDAKDTLQKCMHSFVILSPLPGPLPINKTRENFFPPPCP